VGRETTVCRVFSCDVVLSDGIEPSLLAGAPETPSSLFEKEPALDALAVKDRLGRPASRVTRRL